ncbi:hypothetical protein DL95DRAFT_154122 [Leptodontidium sp. 2 PMI_412]|nr:hypothetical protein DL95DRAFT_154122 [Leptodontidium sp. 2 PMI_412]
MKGDCASRPATLASTSPLSTSIMFPCETQYPLYETEYDRMLGIDWDADRFGMSTLDIPGLLTKFNHTTVPLQSHGSYIVEFERIARVANNQAELLSSLQDYRETQLQGRQREFDSLAERANGHLDQMPRELGHQLGALFEQSVLQESLDWQPPPLDAIVSAVETALRLLHQPTPPSPATSQPVKPLTPEPSLPPLPTSPALTSPSFSTADSLESTKSKPPRNIPTPQSTESKAAYVHTTKAHSSHGRIRNRGVQGPGGNPCVSGRSEKRRRHSLPADLRNQEIVKDWVDESYMGKDSYNSSFQSSYSTLQSPTDISTSALLSTENISTSPQVVVAQIYTDESATHGIASVADKDDRRCPSGKRKQSPTEPIMFSKRWKHGSESDRDPDRRFSSG